MSFLDGFLDFLIPCFRFFSMFSSILFIWFLIALLISPTKLLSFDISEYSNAVLMAPFIVLAGM